MDQPLHNKIFGSTSCLSQEQMLKYGSNALSQKEKHKVEKHLVECEFCSDALEGFAHISADDINAIRSSVQQITSKEKSFTLFPWKRSLLLAATIIGIAFFSFYFIFKENKISEQNLLSEKTEIIPHPLIRPEGGEEGSKETVFDRQQIEVEKEEPAKEDKESIKISEPAEISGGYKIIGKDRLENKVNTLEVVAKGENLQQTDGDFTTAMIADEKDVRQGAALGNSIDQAKTEEISIAPEEALSEIETRSSSRLDWSAQPIAQASAQEKSLEKNKSKKGKNEEEATAMAETNSPAKKAEAESKKSGLKNPESDESADVSEEVAFNASPETINIPAQSEQTGKMNAAEVSREKQTGFNYDETLRAGLSFLKTKNYTTAIEKFNLILKHKPDDISGIFYAGLANFYLGNYDKALVNFKTILSSGNDALIIESNWYIALAYREKNDFEKARAMLKEISKKENAFQKQAADMLEDLEKK